MNHNRLRWLPLWPLAFVLVASIVPAALLFHRAGEATAHAAPARRATISVSSRFVQPGQPITVTGQGFAPNNTGTLLFGGGLTQAAFPCNAHGHCSGVIDAATGIVGGPYTISAFDQGGDAAQATVVIEPLVQSTPIRVAWVPSSSSAETAWSPVRPSPSTGASRLLARTRER